MTMFLKNIIKRMCVFYVFVILYTVVAYLLFQDIIMIFKHLMGRTNSIKMQRHFLKQVDSNLKNERKKEYRCLKKLSNDLCRTCLYGWSGRDCGIPPHPKSVTITERENGRYIVQMSIVNHELDMLKFKIENALPYTGEFITIEGDMTFALESKPYLVEKIAKNLSSLIKLRQYHVHIKTQNKHPWQVQDEMRLSNTSIHELFQEIPLTSVVVFTDLDEVLRPHVLYFLKYYDAVPFPTGVDLDTYLYGFFFHQSRIIKLSSLGNVFQSPKEIRSQQRSWTIPKGGWHCSWCFTIEGIQMKLKSSPFVDLPRIADNPSFMKPSVIYDHVIKGKWILGEEKILPTKPEDVPENAPVYMTAYNWWLQNRPNSSE